VATFGNETGLAACESPLGVSLVINSPKEG
jgi:hypothetical protein